MKKQTGAGKSKPTDDKVMEQIKAKWKLPKEYLKYLSEHPKSVYAEPEDEEFEIYVYGANDLIKAQEGYSYNPVKKADIEDWNPNLVVIADSDADPFCIDISKKRSPIYYAQHGMGDWDFDEYCDSFASFLELLGLD